MKWLLPLGIALAAASLVQCGGSTESTSSTGGSSGSGGSSASGGSSGTSGSSASGGSSGTGGSSGSGGSAGDPSWTACQVNSDCILRPASCCGSCGAATRGDAIALNQQYLGDYSTRACAGGGCPACFMPQDPTLVASCRGGQCEVVDLLTHPATACQTDADCRIRTTDCCECGGATDPDHLIAVSISSGADYSALVCDPNVGCPECEPQYPPVDVTCADGHCIVDTPPNP